MSNVKQILKLLMWPFVLCVRLRKDNGEHEFVLPGLEAILGITLLAVVCSSIFFQAIFSNLFNFLLALFLITIYLLIGLFLIFDSKSNDSKKSASKPLL